MSQDVCGKPIGLAKNGADRGVCTKPVKHSGRHGNGTCASCGVEMTLENASPSIYRGGGSCRNCYSGGSRQTSPMNVQILGQPHTFPCGCFGVLPEQRDVLNKFAVIAGGKSWSCRVSTILGACKKHADRSGYAPMDLSTPHSVIRRMMDNPLCWRCKKPLVWVFGRGQTPHLHHNHDTGEIYGFAHPRCNLEALEDEIDELNECIHKLEARILELESQVLSVAA